LGYAIRIERHDAFGRRAPIQRVEWEAAVAAIEGVRLVEGKIGLGNAVEIDSPGAAEIFDFPSGSWRPAFGWSERGYVTFDPVEGFDDPQSEFGRTVRAIATQLGAKLVGDEGEMYD
jgi:hypothetical protein